jgi:hypothetical protein
VEVAALEYDQRAIAIPDGVGPVHHQRVARLPLHQERERAHRGPERHHPLRAVAVDASGPVRELSRALRVEDPVVRPEAAVEAGDHLAVGAIGRGDVIAELDHVRDVGVVQLGVAEAGDHARFGVEPTARLRQPHLAPPRALEAPPGDVQCRCPGEDAPQRRAELGGGRLRQDVPADLGVRQREHLPREREVGRLGEQLGLLLADRPNVGQEAGRQRLLAAQQPFAAGLPLRLDRGHGRPSSVLS